MKRALKAHGTRAIDRRTSLSKALDRWRDELISDLGGPKQVSTQQLAIITLAVRTKLLLESVDSWLLQQPSLVNARKRSLLPAVVQRQSLADGLARLMGQLGLERRQQRTVALSDYLQVQQRPAKAHNRPATASTASDPTLQITGTTEANESQ